MSESDSGDSGGSNTTRNIIIIIIIIVALVGITAVLLWVWPGFLKSDNNNDNTPSSTPGTTPGSTPGTTPGATGTNGTTGTTGTTGATGTNGSTEPLSPLIQGCYSVDGVEYFVKADGMPCLLSSVTRSMLCQNDMVFGVTGSMVGPTQTVMSCDGSEATTQNVSILTRNANPSQALTYGGPTNDFLISGIFMRNIVYSDPRTQGTCIDYSWNYNAVDGLVRNNREFTGEQTSDIFLSGFDGNVDENLRLVGEVGIGTPWTFIPSPNATRSNPIGRLCTSNNLENCIYENRDNAGPQPVLRKFVDGTMNDPRFNLQVRRGALSNTTIPPCISMIPDTPIPPPVPSPAPTFAGGNYTISNRSMPIVGSGVISNGVGNDVSYGPTNNTWSLIQGPTPLTAYIQLFPSGTYWKLRNIATQQDGRIQTVTDRSEADIFTIETVTNTRYRIYIGNDDARTYVILVGNAIVTRRLSSFLIPGAPSAFPMNPDTQLNFQWTFRSLNSGGDVNIIR